MKLNQDEHRRVMLKILADVAEDPLLANNLGFKGGTACYFVYGLDRFSIDLDFDLLNKDRALAVREQLLKSLSKYGEVKTHSSIKLKYSDEYQNLKIDLSTRYETNKYNTYEVHDIVSGISLKVLKKEDVFAQKLLAITERSMKNSKNTQFIANRDLYDIHFFFSQGLAFNQDIIKLQTNQEPYQYLQKVYEFIEKYANENNMLERLGTLLSQSKRDWVKNNLKKEVLKQIAIEIRALQQSSSAPGS